MNDGEERQGGQSGCIASVTTPVLYSRCRLTDSLSATLSKSRNGRLHKDFLEAPVAIRSTGACWTHSVAAVYLPSRRTFGPFEYPRSPC